LNRSQDSEVYEFLGQLFRDTFGRDDITVHPGLTAADVVGWDSFKQVEIVMALEERFRVRIQPRDVRNLENLGELVRVVQQKRAASSNLPGQNQAS